MAINKVILVGRVARDIEVKEIKAGLSVGSFSLLLEDTYTKKDGSTYVEKTYIDCNLWNQEAQKFQDLAKEELVCLEGRLKSEKWQDKSGNDRFKTVIQVAKMERVLQSQPDISTMIANMQKGSTRTSSQFDKEPQRTSDTIDFRDELPF